MKRFFNWYGVLVIFAVMWLGTTMAYRATLRDQVAAEARQHNTEFSEADFNAEFWAGYFENHQSEYAQLFFQGLFIAAMGATLFKKEKEDLIRIEQKIDQLLKDAETSPQKMKALNQVH